MVSVTVKNIFFNDAFIDTNYSNSLDVRVLYAYPNEVTIGRAIQILSMTSRDIPIVHTKPKIRISIDNRDSYRAECNLENDQQIAFKKDWLPEPFPGDSVEESKKRHIKAGRHSINEVLGLESICACVCDVSFNNILLRSTMIDDQEVLDFSWTSIKLILRSDITLRSIGIDTGCPNYG